MMKFMDNFATVCYICLVLENSKMPTIPVLFTRKPGEPDKIIARIYEDCATVEDALRESGFSPEEIVVSMELEMPTGLTVEQTRDLLKLVESIDNVSGNGDFSWMLYSFIDQILNFALRNIKLDQAPNAAK